MNRIARMQRICDATVNLEYAQKMDYAPKRLLFIIFIPLGMQMQFVQHEASVVLAITPPTDSLSVSFFSSYPISIPFPFPFRRVSLDSLKVSRSSASPLTHPRLRKPVRLVPRLGRGQ